MKLIRVHFNIQYVSFCLCLSQEEDDFQPQAPPEGKAVCLLGWAFIMCYTDSEHTLLSKTSTAIVITLHNTVVANLILVKQSGEKYLRMLSIYFCFLKNFFKKVVMGPLSY